MWQRAFLLNQAIKCLEAHFMTAIMAEKRQELSQRTIYLAIIVFTHLQYKDIKDIKDRHAQKRVERVCPEGSERNTSSALRSGAAPWMSSEASLARYYLLPAGAAS
jgi:hypothetical protein